MCRQKDNLIMQLLCLCNLPLLYETEHEIWFLCQYSLQLLRTMTKITAALLESASVAIKLCSIICSLEPLLLILSELLSGLFQKSPLSRIAKLWKYCGHLLGNLCSWLRASKRFNSVGRRKEQLNLELLKQTSLDDRTSLRTQSSLDLWMNWL